MEIIQTHMSITKYAPYTKYFISMNMGIDIC